MVYIFPYIRILYIQAYFYNNIIKFIYLKIFKNFLYNIIKKTFFNN